MRGTTPRIEMQKCLTEAEAGEADAACFPCEAGSVEPGKRDIECQVLVYRKWRTADPRVVKRAAMAGIDAQRRVHGDAKPLDGIERFRPDAEFAATGAGDLGRNEMRPAFGIPGRMVCKIRNLHGRQPTIQFVPSLTTGTLFAPPPATVDANVVAVASVTNARAPAPAVAAEGSAETTYDPVRT